MNYIWLKKKFKFKKLHKNTIKFNFLNKKNNFFYLSDFILMSISYSKISYNQIESARRVISKKNLKFCFIFNDTKPFMYFTKKSKKSRMGKGKGKLNSIKYILKPGKIIFKVKGIEKKLIIKSLLKASYKLPGFYKIFKL